MIKIWFLQLINVSLSAQEDDSLLKCLIELAENVPKVIRPHMETVFPFCLKASFTSSTFEILHVLFRRSRMHLIFFYKLHMISVDRDGTQFSTTIWNLTYQNVMVIVSIVTVA